MTGCEQIKNADCLCEWNGGPLNNKRENFYCYTVHFDICKFTHQQINFFYLKKHVKIYIKIQINIAPTCFGLRPSSGSLHRTWLKLYLC